MRRRILISFATGIQWECRAGFSCRIAFDAGFQAERKNEKAFAGAAHREAILSVHLIQAGKHSIPCARVKRAIEWCRDSGQLLFSATRWERTKTS